MKKLPLFFLAILLITAASCSSTYHAGTPANDDVYYSSHNGSQSQPATNNTSGSSQPTTSAGDYSSDNSNYEAPSGQTPDYTEQKQENGNTYITNNYYNDDDYYNYAYTARLRRFYSPAYGYGYYDPFYTNLYWYDYNPYSWGISIYLGYNWWAPTYYYYQPFCYGGYYSSWYYPYYGYGSGYWMGYQHGYYDGYYDGYYNSMYGYNPYYYNSYDNNTYYYGPRGSVSSNSRASTDAGSFTYAESAYTGSRIQKTLGEKYVDAVNTGRVSDSKHDMMMHSTGPVKTTPSNDHVPVNNPTGSKNNAGSSTLDGSRAGQTSSPSKGIISTKNEAGRNQIGTPSKSNSAPQQQQQPADIRTNPQGTNRGNIQQNGSGMTKDPRNETAPQQNNRGLNRPAPSNNSAPKDQQQQGPSKKDEPVRLNREEHQPSPMPSPQRQENRNPETPKYNTPRERMPQQESRPRQEQREARSEMRHQEAPQMSMPSRSYENRSTPPSNNQRSGGDGGGRGRR